MEELTPTAAENMQVSGENDAEKAKIMQGAHAAMMEEGAVVTVPYEVLESVSQSFPDLRGVKKKERTPLLKEAMSKLKSNIRKFLDGFKNKSFEFEVNGKILEARLYNTGVNEVMEKITQSKANIPILLATCKLMSSETIKATGSIHSA